MALNQGASPFLWLFRKVAKKKAPLDCPRIDDRHRPKVILPPEMKLPEMELGKVSELTKGSLTFPTSTSGIGTSP